MKSLWNKLTGKEKRNEESQAVEPQTKNVNVDVYLDYLEPVKNNDPKSFGKRYEANQDFDDDPSSINPHFEINTFDDSLNKSEAIWDFKEKETRPIDDEEINRKEAHYKSTNFGRWHAAYQNIRDGIKNGDKFQMGAGLHAGAHDLAALASIGGAVASDNLWGIFLGATVGSLITSEDKRKSKKRSAKTDYLTHLSNANRRENIQNAEYNDNIEVNLVPGAKNVYDDANNFYENEIKGSQTPHVCYSERQFMPNVFNFVLGKAYEKFKSKNKSETKQE